MEALIFRPENHLFLQRTFLDDTNKFVAVVYDYVSATNIFVKLEKLKVPASFELATFCVLSRRDNHYTTEPVIILSRSLVQEATWNMTELREKSEHFVTGCGVRDRKQDCQGSGEFRTRDLLRVKQT